MQMPEATGEIRWRRSTVAMIGVFRLSLILGIGFTAGCGGFAARRMAQAPNRYPKWLAPEAPVTLEFGKDVLSAFTNEFAEIESPKARIRYRVVEPANYHFHWTNHVDRANGHTNFKFSARVDALAERTNRWSAHPRGTVLLVHGYGVAGFAMLHWGLLLAQEGWRCVVVDLRGHGKSTGKRIYFGIQEARDLRQLLDDLEADGQVERPVAVLGDSMGAVAALRWQAMDERIHRIVAIAPYANLDRAILNIAREYADWLPHWFLKAGLRELPSVLGVNSCELNPECWLPRTNGRGESALFVAGGEDRIAPETEVQRLEELCRSIGGESRLLVLPAAGHEALPFYLDDLAEPVIEWLGAE